ncbi:non-canonical purine NTP pyrophosphatase [Spiroplasma floricola]|uniref:non-canonical purine NTP pyrophosphatase n=1 Tax=Spiroplasma floricola TaxID=216937 RepID=UPI0012FD39DF
MKYYKWNAFRKIITKWTCKWKTKKGIFTSTIVFIDKEKEIEKVFTGIIDGTIVSKQIGENGFAYDKIFKPDNYDKTFAQMSKEEKNSISHRNISIEKLRNYLKNNNYF